MPMHLAAGTAHARHRSRQQAARPPAPRTASRPRAAAAPRAPAPASLSPPGPCTDAPIPSSAEPRARSSVPTPASVFSSMPAAGVCRYGNRQPTCLKDDDIWCAIASPLPRREWSHRGHTCPLMVLASSNTGLRLAPPCCCGCARSRGCFWGSPAMRRHLGRRASKCRASAGAWMRCVDALLPPWWLHLRTQSPASPTCAHTGGAACKVQPPRGSAAAGVAAWQGLLTSSGWAGGAGRWRAHGRAACANGACLPQPHAADGDAQRTAPAYTAYRTSCADAASPRHACTRRRRARAGRQARPPPAPAPARLPAARSACGAHAP